MKARLMTIDETSAGQRIDNFLLRELKGLPKSRIYKAIRKGEVRVNKGRVKAEYKLRYGDCVRVPPLRVAEQMGPVRPGAALAAELERRIIFENNKLLIIDKPSGLPVHGGTNVSAGLIEMLRSMRPQAKFLELVHRIDRETSGCLLIAKRRSVLVALHETLLQRTAQKAYLALIKGQWEGGARTVSAPLQKNHLQSGERVVRVDRDGKPAQTRVRLLHQYKDTALVLAEPKTGRTHQIRVHLAHIGHPIVGDHKYGDAVFNRQQSAEGFKRLMLHSASFSAYLEALDWQIGIGVAFEANIAQRLREKK